MNFVHFLSYYRKTFSQFMFKSCSQYIFKSCTQFISKILYPVYCKNSVLQFPLHRFKDLCNPFWTLGTSLGLHFFSAPLHAYCTSVSLITDLSCFHSLRRSIQWHIRDICITQLPIKLQQQT